MVRFAKGFTSDVEFSAEDATRSDWAISWHKSSLLPSPPERPPSMFLIPSATPHPLNMRH
jgi:hypothetical protein